MAVQKIISEANANVNNFVIIKTPPNAFTIDAKVSLIVGAPTWSLLVSNVGDVEANFKEYSIATNNMAILTAIESDTFNFEFIAIKYTANAATGTYSFFISEK